MIAEAVYWKWIPSVLSGEDVQQACLHVYIYHDQTQLYKNVQGELLPPTPLKKKWIEAALIELWFIKDLQLNTHAVSTATSHYSRTKSDGEVNSQTSGPIISFLQE